MDLSLYHAEIAAVEGSAGRSHTSPRLLISLWLYAYGRGISSARELSRQCEFEPGFVVALWVPTDQLSDPIRISLRPSSGTG